MAVFQFDIVTPEKGLYSGAVESLKVPGSEGEMGVLARHMPLLSALCTGRIHFSEEGGVIRHVATSGGFVEVEHNHVTVLAETAEFAEEIDTVRAQAAQKRAEERLARIREEKLDEARAQAALDRALNRLRIGGGL
ncbi:MAG: F0F1 ATP synthase subunit epsilon [Candidatus Latescibacteria bacterium]|nr:F0F1 ATP synthase subunit epsilon [Candidatus Latescibacterota bacterium]